MGQLMGEARHFISFGEFTLFLDNKRRQLNYVQAMLESRKWRGTKKMSNLWRKWRGTKKMSNLWKN